MGIPRLDLCVKPVETFNCKTCQAAWREEEEQELHCFKHCVVNWLIEHLCNSEISFLTTHHPACHSLLSPLTHFPFSDGFQHEMRAGVKFCWKSKEKLSWQTPSLLLRPEISRCWGKGRLVLKFPLITFSWGGQDGTRWLHCGSTVEPLPRQDIQWASLASSTVTPPGSNCSLSSISSITTRLTDSLLARL